MPRGILSKKSAMFFFFGIIALTNVLLMLLIESCSSVGAVGNLDLASLMVGGILCMLCCSFAKVFVENLFIKGLGGISASSIIVLRP